MVVVGFRSQSELDLPEPVHEALAQYRLAEVGYLKANDGAAAAVPVHDATRSLVRALQAYPEQADGAAATICAKAADGGTPTQRVESLSLFLEQLQDLRDVLFEKLLTTVDEVRDLFLESYLREHPPTLRRDMRHACLRDGTGAGGVVRLQPPGFIPTHAGTRLHSRCSEAKAGVVVCLSAVWSCAIVAVSCRRCGGGVRHKP